MLVSGSVTATELSRIHGLTVFAIKRHKASHLTDRAGLSLAVHRKVGAMIQAAQSDAELDLLYEQAKADGQAARTKGDLRTALRSIDTLCRIYELQAKLVLEASQGRAQDVVTHPMFLKFMGRLLSDLTQLSGARERVEAVILRELGALPRGYPGGTT